MKTLCALLVSGLLAMGCGRGEGGVQVIVTSDGMVSDVASLSLTVTLNGQDSMVVNVPIANGPIAISAQNQKTVSLRFASDKQGAIQVSVTALDVNHQTITTGDGNGVVQASQDSTVTVVLRGVMMPDMTVPPDLTMPDLTMPDLTMPDLTMPDLTPIPDLTLMPDLAMPDLAMPDLTMPDLTIPPDMSCAPGWTHCNGVCVDLRKDGTNCGKCGVSCQMGFQCLGSVCRQPCTGTLALPGPPLLETGGNPYAIATGDLNGDGKPDLVVANDTDNSVSVFLGRGGGTFKEGSKITTDKFPESVALGDVNGDGKKDLAVVNWGTGDVWVMLGNGDGTFQPPGNKKYTFMGRAAAVAMGDLNGDGHPDLAVANYYDKNVGVLLNDGNVSGTFTVGPTYPTGGGIGNPVALAIGDLDGIGQPDLAVVNYVGGNSSVNVLLNKNDGKGTFNSAVSYPTGNGSTSVAIGDVDGDNKQDLVVTNDGDSSLSVLVNKGNGMFSPQVTYPIPLTPWSVVVDDLNGDGKKDLAVTIFGGSGVGVLLNKGTNGNWLGFAPEVTFPTGNSPFALVIFDPDDPKGIKKDLAIVNKGDNTVSVLLNDGTATFGVEIPYPAGGGPLGMAVGDLNNDNFSDLAVADFTDNGVSVLPNGGGAFPTQAPVPYATGTGPVSVAMGYFNNDKALDLAVTNTANNNISVLLNLGQQGNWKFGMQKTVGTGQSPRSVAAGDLNGDSKVDLVVTNTMDKTVSVLCGNGDGTFKLQMPFATDMMAATGPHGVAVGDLNGDGKPDLAVTNPDANSVSVLLNTTMPNSCAFSFGAQILYPAGLLPEAIAIGDLDGDGKPDLAVTNRGAAQVVVLLNDGKGGFPQNLSTPYPAGRSYSMGLPDMNDSIVIADLNDDGSLDLAVSRVNDLTVPTGNEFAVSVLLNNRDGTFAPQSRYTTGFGPISVAAADLDGDGRIDLAVANRRDNSVSVLRNTACLP